ncbi:MAG: sigma-70 family RNA polymerase sigma factor [Actinobacteria bacterium]|nr:sigma-70 family RNA polymerase sigma factor [Actinomycetota bacterium]
MNVEPELVDGHPASRRGPDDATDAALVGRAQSGDHEALEALLRRHHDRVLAVCHRMCRDRSDAEDAAQEALIAIVRGIDRFDGRSMFSTWAYRVTTNCCLDELRRRRRRPDPIGDAHIPEPASTDTGPEAQAEGSDERRRLGVLLDSLPDEFRVPLVLRDVADLDYATIGEILDLPPGTVRSRIARGRARLAQALGAGNHDERPNVTSHEGP